jgi:hypothetical protein
MGRAVSSADECRRRREAFELALKLGCTPREAADQLRRAAAQEQEAASKERMAARETRRLTPPNPRPKLWYQED